MQKGFSDKERQLLQQGAFAKRIDLWSEAARYFRPIHAGMISAMLDTLQMPLLERGYVAGRETSLQIAAGREPDIFIQQDVRPPSNETWQYEIAAAEVLAEVGTQVELVDDLSALFIRDAQSGDLVTVIEVISPGNKTRDYEIGDYQQRRSRLLLEKSVNVVEIDLTRSIKRLIDNPVTQHSPYHVAVFLPRESVRIIEIGLEQSLPRIAIPLYQDVIPIVLQDMYDAAYQQTLTAWHIQHETDYAESALPFPSTLSDAQRRDATQKVKQWQDLLRRFDTNKN